MRRLVACSLLVLVLLTGCGLSPDDGTTNRDSSVPTESGQDDVPPESGRSDDDRGSGSGDEDERDIEIAGPTLDNTFPTNPWALPEPGRSSCVLLYNTTASVPVRVLSMQLEQQQPADDPGLVLGEDPRDASQCGPSYLPEATIQDQCPGAVLPPFGEQPEACPVEVRSVGSVGTDYTATLVLRLGATCTGVGGTPCSELDGQANPTPSEPVEIVWTMTQAYCSCLVERDRGGAEFLDEEASGECPTDGGTPSGSPSQDPDSDPEPSEDLPDSSETASPGESSPDDTGSDASAAAGQ